MEYFYKNVNKFVYICTMSTLIDKYKGIHPGIILERLLNKKGISQRPFALSIDEYPQTINAISKGKRKLNTPLALKIEKKLNLEEGTLALLQTYFDIKEEKNKVEQKTPNLNLLRTSLFWDTDISKIDWQNQSIAVIKRVFERGNDIEKEEIKRFYTSEKIKEALSKAIRKPYTIYRNKGKV
jgi:plasmid maintenance system antidote protein VapI